MVLEKSINFASENRLAQLARFGHSRLRITRTTHFANLPYLRYYSGITEVCLGRRVTRRAQPMLDATSKRSAKGGAEQV
jgi:hypothetical protein